uniref:C-X-C chemokine receptor type 3-like n=1 Tax=Scatophagus argus TaxID=75038 RepID=UPI001ED83139|nr:C-X-C chemokine receptor type 3-like [Scatophagus argus]XP_046254242.1 C-X-C chemokine receptor type 3-like [Scatophagus argus]XP_046254243.1 C-X-C chemokine receptor type 3-like [Scatophagus argus]XP_046254244.1 C-X-C chemokine receptor type 3-like [Scatophagus argus]
MDVVLDGLFRYNSSYDYDDYEYKDEFESGHNKALWMTVLFSVELVIGLLGNGLLLASVVQKRRFWSTSGTFVLHLSVADLLLLVTLPFWAAQAAQRCEWCFRGFLCKIAGGIFNVNFYCGILLFVCLSVDRYLSVVHATHLYSQRRPRLAHISCLVVWIISLILAIPGWASVEVSAPEKTLCVYKFTHSHGSQKHMVSRLVHLTLGFLLPGAILIICWSCILLRLQRNAKGLQKQRSIMVILSLLVVFFLCWMPYNVTLLVDTIRRRSAESNDSSSGNPEGSPKTALMVTFALGCIHACLRPLLYFCLCANFRKQTLAMLSCATAESEGSLWELDVGEKAMPGQSDEGAELKQMTSVDHQMQSSQC